MEINARLEVDFRHYIPKIRAKAKNKVVESINTPGVRAEIHANLLEAIQNRIPVDTGALAYSPYTENGYEPMKRVSGGNYVRYAHGDITDDAITFDPITDKGYHYASRVKGFYPYRWINANKKNTYRAIRDAIVKEVNKRD